jgi:hypothetical protein
MARPIGCNCTRDATEADRAVSGRAPTVGELQHVVRAHQRAHHVSRSPNTSSLSVTPRVRRPPWDRDCDSCGLVRPPVGSVWPGDIRRAPAAGWGGSGSGRGDKAWGHSHSNGGVPPDRDPTDAAARAGRQRCGLLLGSGGFVRTRYRPALNHHSTPMRTTAELR